MSCSCALYDSACRSFETPEHEVSRLRQTPARTLVRLLCVHCVFLTRKNLNTRSGRVNTAVKQSKNVMGRSFRLYFVCAKSLYSCMERNGTHDTIRYDTTRYDTMRFPPPPPPHFVSLSHREVTVEGNKAFVRLGRQELEQRVRSLEACTEEARARHGKALRKAVGERDALKAEVACLR